MCKFEYRLWPTNAPVQLGAGVIGMDLLNCVDFVSPSASEIGNVDRRSRGGKRRLHPLWGSDSPLQRLELSIGGLEGA